MQRRSATLKAFDAVAIQWLSLRFLIRRTFASRFAIVCGQFLWASPMMFSQLVEICRQLVENRTVIADTRRNIVVNSSKLGFNIRCHIVATRTLLVATRQKSASISCYIVATRSNSYTTRAMLPCLARRRERTRSHDISTRSVRQSTRALRDRYDLRSSHFRRRVVARFFNSLKFS